MLKAAELHRRGLDASNAGSYRRARSLFVTAQERSDGGEELARILLSRAHVEAELGSLDEGLASCDRALEVPELSTALRGLIQSQRAMLLGRSGRADESLAAFDDAIRDVDGDEARMTAYLNRGNVHLMRSDPRRAIADFERAVVHAGRAEQPVARAKAEFNLGYAQLLAGDLVAALQQMDRARPVLASLSLVSEAVCDQDRAEVLSASGMIDEAEQALRQSAAAFAARGLRQQQAEAEFVLARLLLFENSTEAARIARQASKRFARRGSDAWARRADAIALSAQLRLKRPTQRLDQQVESVVATLRADGLDREAQALLLQSARALAVGERVDDAASRLSEARLTARSPLPARLLAREVRARVARTRGRRTDAWRQLRHGLADLHAWQSSFGSLEMQSSIVGHGRSLALEGMRVALDDGRPEVVFEWAERARALASRVTPLRPPLDDDAAADLTELRQLQIEINESEAHGVVSKAAITRANALRDQIRQRAWYGAGSGVVVEPSGLASIVSELGSAKGAVLSFLVVDEQIYCLVVTAHHPELVSLGALSEVRTYLDGMQADLDMSAAKLPAAIADVVKTALRRRMTKLAEILVRPIEDRIGDGPLVIVPSATLAGVPWTLLDGFAGRPITVPRSATSWLADRAVPFALESAGFVAGPRVPRAAEEVERASASWSQAQVLEGEDALSQPVRQLASRVDVFHAAAHGRHSADNPLFSGLELADGPWFGYDIDQVGSIPSTIVLSACEVGRSSVRWGEETLGMTVAWLHAGARCVIASPALVNDDAACDVLTATHDRLAKGLAPSMALAEAVAEAGGDALVPFLCFGSGW